MDAPAPSRSTSRWLPQSADVLIGLGLGAVIIVGLAFDVVVEDRGEVTWSTYVLSAMAAVATCFRRIAPVATLAVVVICQATSFGTGSPPHLAVFLIWFGLYTVAAERSRRTIILIAVSMPAMITLGGLVFGPPEGGEPTPFERGFFLIVTLLPVIIGDSVRSRRAEREATEARLAAMEASRDAEAREAVQAERLRIARDLHDVVAHSIATINVQSGAASRVVEAEPALAREALDEIRQASKVAMDELRATLRVLRSDGTELELAPAPGLGQLGALVAAHPDAELSVTGDAPEGLDAGVQLAAYRIVQEALTNTLKHARGAMVRVQLDHHGDHLDIAVTNDDAGAVDPDAEPGGGHGLVGLRERADAVGGSLRSGPRLDGGFSVEATLPHTPMEVAE